MEMGSDGDHGFMNNGDHGTRTQLLSTNWTK